MNKFSLAALLIIVFAIGAMLLAKNGFLTQDPIQVGDRLVEEREPAKPADKRQATSKPLSELLGVSEEEMVIVGDIKRPKRDVEGFKSDPAEYKTKNLYPYPGKSPALDPNQNAEVAGLFSEIQKTKTEGKFDSAKSAYFKPEPFNQTEFESNPQAYLQKVRPGRVFYPAQPGADVAPLVSNSKPFHTVLQGETVLIEVEASAGAPISFYTPDIGSFSNGLKSITKAADENGLATAAYTAGPGTQGLMRILAASPVHSGQLRYRVNVMLPENN